MANFAVEINSSATFGSIDEARAVGSALDKLLASGEAVLGSTRIYEFATSSYHAVVKPTYDRSKVVTGFQEAEAKASKLATVLDQKFDGENVDWSEFIAESTANGEVNIENLQVFVLANYDTDEDTAINTIVAAIGQIAADEVNRSLQTAKNQRARLAKQAAQAARTKKK